MHLRYFLFSPQKKVVRPWLLKTSFILIQLTLVFGCSNIEATEQHFHYLNIKQVIETDDNINSNYEYGRNLYPQYSYHGLPDNFLIKKDPDISISPKDIELVEIKRMPFSPPNMQVYTIAIHFHPIAANKIKAYTEQNLSNRIALEIDGKIFVIVKVLDITKDEVNITLGKISLDEIEKEVRKICDNVVADDDK